MLATQKVVSEIKAPHHIKTTARYADGCDGVVGYMCWEHVGIVPELVTWQ
jgi:hypothetical protein